MSRGRRRGGKRPAGSPARPGAAAPLSPRARGNARRLASLGLVLAAIGGAILVWRFWNPRGGRSGAPSEPDSISSLGPRQAYEQAVRLVHDHRPVESLAYFRHSLTYPSQSMQVHADYATGLYGASMVAATRLGLTGFAARSSIERIALMRQALDQLEIAERLARTPGERSYVQGMRAHDFVLWGLPWEALLEFRRAQESDPSWPWAQMGDVLAARVHHPDRREPAGTQP